MHYYIKTGFTLKLGLRSFFILIAISTLCTCIDPFNPKLGGYMSLLVVDGLITDSNNSNTIRLSRTFQDANNGPLMISDATVYITDDNETSTYLINKGNGIYETDSIEFKGFPGRTYVLHIQTDGVLYESDPCIMQSVPDIDSIYFEKEEELINNGTQSQKGIRIYLDSKGGDKNQFYRWSFDETWKFKVPYPKRFNFNMADSAITAVDNVKEFCWKTRKSGDILIYSNSSGQTLPIRKEPIFFIAADQSDRLLIQYSILVNQYSISKNEYDFWNNLNQVNENGADIFSKLPFTVVSNIKNVKNPKERVLGFFQVSAVKQKRKNITLSDIAGLNLPYFHYSCERFVKDPSDYPKGPGVPPTTWAEIYSMWCVTSDYYFVEPQYSSGSNISKMVFAKPECANCELTGTSKKPDFWVDLN
jgi:hypothetical protein